MIDLVNIAFVSYWLFLIVLESDGCWKIYAFVYYVFADMHVFKLFSN